MCDKNQNQNHDDDDDLIDEDPEDEDDDEEDEDNEEEEDVRSSLLAKKMRLLRTKMRAWLETGFNQAVFDHSQLIENHTGAGCPEEGVVRQLKQLAVEIIRYARVPFALADNALSRCEASSLSSAENFHLVRGEELRSIMGFHLVGDKDDSVEDDDDQIPSMGRVNPGKGAFLVASPQVRFRGKSLCLFGDLVDLVVDEIKVGRNSQLFTSSALEARAFAVDRFIDLDDCRVGSDIRIHVTNRSDTKPALIGGLIAGVTLGMD